MVIKEMLFKGKKADELKRMSLQEVALLVPSDARRKINRMTDKEKKFLEKVEKSKKQTIKTHLRCMVILPAMIGRSISVHDGKAYQPVIITEEMIGHRLGEFAMTRKKVNHNSPGIGATKSSSSLSVK